MLKKNIFITGFMGTGKSTVAKHLASQLNYSFVDMDQLIEQQRGESVIDIFQQHGEHYFRKLEKALLKNIIRKDSQVVATGGGALMDDSNYELCQRNGMVILLQAHPKVIYERLKTDQGRPLLSGEDKLADINRLLQQRNKKYGRIYYQIDTSYLRIQEVVTRIMALLFEY